MGSCRRTIVDPRDNECDPGAGERDRSCPVRLSLLCRESLVAILLVGVAGYLVSMSQDGWPGNQSGRKSLRGHDTLIESVVYAPDGRTLISCGWDKRVRLWDVAEDQPEWGRQIDSLPHDWHVFAIAMTGDGKYLASAGAGGLSIWARPGADAGWELIDQHRGVAHRCLAASPDCHTLAVGGSDGSLRLWDIAASKELMLLGRFADQLRTINYSPSGSFIAASSFSGEFQIWDLKSPGHPRALAGGPDSVQSFLFAPDDRTLAVARSGERASSLCLWDMPTGTTRLTLSDNPAGNNALALSPDGLVLASADKDATIRFWDSRTGNLKGTLGVGVSWVKTLAFSPDGRRIAFGGHDGSIQFRDLALVGSQTQPNNS